MAAGEQLAQVEPGDVLQHAAAGVDRFAVPGHRADAEHVVAHRTPGDAARAGEIGGDHAAESLLFARAGRRREVGRFGDQVLAVLGERGFDLGSGVPARAEMTSSFGE